MNTRLVFSLTALLTVATPALACDCSIFPFQPKHCEGVCMARGLSQIGSGVDGKSNLIQLGIGPEKAAELIGRTPTEIEGILAKDPSIKSAVNLHIDRTRSFGIEKFGEEKGG